jgi:hypothetical protein
LCRTDPYHRSQAKLSHCALRPPACIDCTLHTAHCTLGLMTLICLGQPYLYEYVRVRRVQRVHGRLSCCLYLR